MLRTLLSHTLSAGTLLIAKHWKAKVKVMITDWLRKASYMCLMNKLAAIKWGLEKGTCWILKILLQNGQAPRGLLKTQPITPSLAAPRSQTGERWGATEQLGSPSPEGFLNGADCTNNTRPSLSRRGERSEVPTPSLWDPLTRFHMELPRSSSKDVHRPGTNWVSQLRGWKSLPYGPHDQEGPPRKSVLRPSGKPPPRWSSQHAGGPFCELKIRQCNKRDGNTAAVYFTEIFFLVSADIESAINDLMI